MKDLSLSPELSVRPRQAFRESQIGCRLFSYGNVFFYRLRKPFVEHGEADSQDWLLGVDELSMWLASLNNPASLKVS